MMYRLLRWALSRMGFRTSLVRIQSPRHRKARDDSELCRVFFLPERAGLAKPLANSPGVPAGGASPLDSVAGFEQRRRLLWVVRENRTSVTPTAGGSPASVASTS